MSDLPGGVSRPTLTSAEGRIDDHGMTTWMPASTSAFPAALGSAPAGATPSLVTLYRQVSDDLVRCIAERGLKPGYPLPPEVELCRAYGVSRITIRKALEEVVARHLVLRTPHPTIRRA